MTQTAHFPTSIQALTPEWVTAALRRVGALTDGRVTTVEARPVGEQGQTSEVFRLTLSYAGGRGPRALILKLPSPHPQVRAAQQALGTYTREVHFYQHLGTDAGVSVPHCYAADLDAETGDFILLLEDMSDCRVGDLWASRIEDVAHAAGALARMHAQWWCSPELRAHAWLPQHDDARYQAMLGGAYRAALPVARAKYPEYFADYLDEVAQDLSDRWTDWVTHRQGTPFTLVHNDFHPKQLFFAGEEAGRFAVFDWQNVLVGRPTFDLTRLLLKGLRPAELREHQDALLRRYHAALVANGVGISLKDILDEWRSSLLHTLAYTVFVVANTDTDDLDVAASRRGVDFRERLLADLAESLRDNEVHRVLRGERNPADLAQFPDP